MSETTSPDQNKMWTESVEAAEKVRSEGGAVEVMDNIYTINLKEGAYMDRIS